MVRPAPISLRIRSAEVTHRARKLLHKLDEEDRLQRRVKWKATKTLIALGELRDVAEPKLRAMYPSDSERWRAECQLVESILVKISKRGV